jgi:hypothetical protein
VSFEGSEGEFLCVFRLRLVLGSRMCRRGGRGRAERRVEGGHYSVGVVEEGGVGAGDPFGVIDVSWL